MNSAPYWLYPWLLLSEDSAPPLAVTPVHPESVGSYGPEAVEWIEANVPGADRLRWWQRYAIVRQLEHRADGSLSWRSVIESCPRRAGKSVRLRAVALWRIAEGPRLFAEPQLAIHTGKDVAIVREVHRRAWPWATARHGWKVSRGVGQEEVIQGDVNRWLVRSTDSVYGYDVCLGVVDEAWAVPPTTVTDGLEPATLERISPQLLLTSTAHRRATSLMPGRISAALAAEDGKTLLMLWGIPEGADVGDPAAWRAASPHWSQDRAEWVEAKYRAALAGEVDPSMDDPDPVASFASQYLNRWELTETSLGVGDPLVEAEAWHARGVSAILPAEQVAVEGWVGEGVSVASAARNGEGGVVVSVQGFDTAAEAAVHVHTLRPKRLLVGASLLEDRELWVGLRAKPAKGTARQAVSDLAGMLREGTFEHDGGEVLAGQVLAVRTKPAADGVTIVSRHRLDAVKAASWAAQALMSRRVYATPGVAPR